VSGVLLAVDVSLIGEGVKGTAVAGGDRALPNAPASEVRPFGVLATMVLLLDSGLGFGTVWTLCICVRGCFLISDTGLVTEGALLGVDMAVVAIAALTLLLPGAVIDPFGVELPRRLGVVGLA